jgi:hypothetical protein
MFGLILEEGCVLFDEGLLLVRHVVERVDRIGSADRNAGATIDAVLRIYEKLGGRVAVIGIRESCESTKCAVGCPSWSRSWRQSLP